MSFTSHILVMEVCAATPHICLLLSPFFDALVLKTISGFCSVCVFRYPTLRPLSGVVLKLGKQPMFGGLSLSLLGLPQGKGRGPAPRATAVSLCIPCSQRSAKRVGPGDFRSRWQSRAAGWFVTASPQTGIALPYDLLRHHHGCSVTG